MDLQVRYRDDMGHERLSTPRALRGLPVEEWPVLHEQRAYRGRKSKVRQWWSSTTKKEVSCRSREHAYAAMFLDRDPRIGYLAAPSLQVEWREGERAGVVNPAFLARTVEGQQILYLHSPAGREPDDQEWSVARAAAAQAGWQVDVARAPGGQLRRKCVHRLAVPSRRVRRRERQGRPAAGIRPAPAVEQGCRCCGSSPRAGPCQQLELAVGTGSNDALG
ncbi:hypothetical protein [Streptomyces ureilyticus]|uniref:hypothetical protein n=1 Tax=Streptomyces ureilyticus TaxID=1775131 RepID=UPI001F265788|nr:hypothetical protein [Streptomyces ureilyticus]